MKSNPYVYPYTPFADLGNKKLTSSFVEGEKLSTEAIKSLVSKLKQVEVAYKGETVDEKILSIFLDEQVLFGPREYVEDNSEKWVEGFKVFTSENKPIVLTILGFPFKMPVPIKTNRKHPDMGEVLSLKRLYDLTQLISKVYSPGAAVTIFTEGVFGRFNNQPEQEYKTYKDDLFRIVQDMGWDKNISLLELEEMEKLDPNFSVRFDQKVEQNKKLFAENDESFMKKYEGARDSILRIINTRDLNKNIELLMDVYNDKLSDSEVSPEVVEVRKYIEKNAHETLLRYHAYLMVRDDLDYIYRTLPNAITLSVSPKPNRLGVIPVTEDCVRLPYHGVPIYHRDNNYFTIEYLIDIMRDGNEYTKIYWESDSENLPFYYSVK